MVRPTVSPIQARVLGAVLGMTGFALASVSGLMAAGVAADTHIPDGKIWVTNDGDKKGPPQGDAVRVIDCNAIDVWAGELNDKSGRFDIVFDDHDGKDRTVESNLEWDFSKDTAKHEDQQVIATIDRSKLVDALHDKGFDAQDNGWHLDLVFHDDRGTIDFILKKDCGEESQGGGGGGESAPTPVEQQQAPVSKPAPKLAGAAVVPQTGADVPFAGGAMLVGLGGAFLGLGRRRRRTGR